MAKWILAARNKSEQRLGFTNSLSLGYSACKVQMIPSLSLSARKADHDIRQWYENTLNTVCTRIHGEKTGKKV